MELWRLKSILSAMQHSLNSLIKDQKKLKELLAEIPIEPGCYLFKDQEDRLLYVGKSINLRNRVRSYFRNDSKHSPRISLMVKQIYDIEYIITDNETEALSLESNLIKNNQPHYNVLLKDDKKYPYVCITWSEEYPRIYITRKRLNKNSKDRYYGPYVDVGFLRQTLFHVKSVFPLRQRPRPLYKDRTCLYNSIGRCPGVCQKIISPEEYKKTITQVSMIFQGRNEELKRLLNVQMSKYSDRMDYEAAATIRDQLYSLDKLNQYQKVILPNSTVNRDILSIALDERIAIVQLFQMRGGKLIGRLGFTYDSMKTKADYILQKAVEEHYSHVEPVEIPSEIVVQSELPQADLVEDWLCELKGNKVNLVVPQKSSKAEMVKLVFKNAELELKRVKSGLELNISQLEDLAILLELDKPPRRIEGYDISHISGTDVVASQVVFIDGIPAKQHYRKFNIKNDSISIGHSDDYIALAEVIRRRFRKWANLKKNGADIILTNKKNASSLNLTAMNDWPDLIIIDGGKGQLSAVTEVFKELDLFQEISLCSLAKRNEEIFIPGVSHPVNSNKNQPGVLLARRLRDEAHRFAVSFHRKLRSKRMSKSSLDGIKGLGKNRINLLLNHFKSMEAIQMATLEQLIKIPGLGPKNAKNIWDYFHSEGSALGTD